MMIKKTKNVKSFNALTIAALSLSACLLFSCNEEMKETLDEETIVEEAIVEEVPELSFSKSISLEDEYGNAISFEISSNVQAELDDYSASSFEFKAMKQEDLLAANEEEASIDEDEESLDDDLSEEETQELPGGDPFVFKETSIHLNQEAGFIAYQLTMKPEVTDGLEDRRDRRPYYFETTAPSATVNSRKSQWSKRIYGYWDVRDDNGNVLYPIDYGKRMCCYSFQTKGKLIPSSPGKLHIKVSAQYRDHFAVSFLYWLDPSHDD